jgi:hypothetical protein
MSRMEPLLPATLVEAHDLLQRERPRLADKPQAWIAYHRRSAEVYAHVAKTDLRHKHEAPVLGWCRDPACSRNRGQHQRKLINSPK